jgi:HEPN domain-containing protein
MALEWLKAADDDLVLISSIVDNITLTHLAAFHSQQSIEKSFKAILEFNDKKVPKEHDLLRLKDLLCGSFEIDDEDILEVLNSLYIESRYPGNLGLLPNGKPTLGEAKDFFNFAKDIHFRATKLVKGDLM